MVFINDLKPRQDIHILNPFKIINSHNNDFHIVIYYIQPNKCKIILRKLNNIHGWINNLEIKIFDKQNPENYEYLNIGSCNKNYKILNYYLKYIKLYKKQPKKLKIPKIIVQTHKSNSITNVLALNSIYSFQELNPDYEYQFFNNVQCREFIKKHFNDDYVFYYDILYPGAFKALTKNDELILCQDYHKTGLYNAVMMSAPKNILFLDVLHKIKYKIQNFSSIYNTLSKKEYNKLESILSLTGPNLLYEMFHTHKLNNKKHVLMKHDILGNYKNYKNLVVRFRDKLFLYKNYPQFEISSIHYSTLWKNNTLFYTHPVKINNCNLYIEPNNNHMLVYQLKIYFIHSKILIIDRHNVTFNFICIEPNSNVHSYKNLKHKSSTNYY